MDYETGEEFEENAFSETDETDLESMATAMRYARKSRLAGGSYRASEDGAMRPAWPR
jgi:hypothetical protein